MCEDLRLSLCEANADRDDRRRIIIGDTHYRKTIVFNLLPQVVGTAGCSTKESCPLKFKVI
jgi:hypothetical protein